jgi:ADP-ribosylglycohydrolase
LRAEIDQTREDLAETVEELSHRVDPREQARSAAQAARETARTHRPQLVVAGSVVVALLIIRRIVGRKKNS